VASRQAGEITPEEALARMEELAGAPITPFPIEPHVARALQIATLIAHPVYDCFYLALAEHDDIEVITDDRRFAAAVAVQPDLAGRVRLLAG
jgi:predicted nucleic acid-binding protein